MDENDPSGNFGDDPAARLDRALAAMRREPELGEFPAERVLPLRARVLAGVQTSIQPQRKKTMRFMMKFAAAVILAFGLGALALVLTHGGGSVAFADVAKQIREARTMTVETVSKLPGQPAVHMKAMFREPGLCRFENGDVVSVTDTAVGTVLTYNQKDKTAVLVHFKEDGATTRPAAAAGGIDWFDRLKKIAAGGAEGGKPVGEKTVDGRKLKGFEASENGQRTVVWADEKTGTPVRAELFVDNPAAFGIVGADAKEPLVVLEHIKLDEALPESLFSLKPPQGYTLQEAKVHASEEAPNEKDVTEFLREFAKRTGRFPAAIGPAHWQEVFEAAFPPVAKDKEKAKEKGTETGGAGNEAAPGKAKPIYPEATQFTIGVTRVGMFLGTLKDGWHYDGASARPGNAADMVFWYVPAGRGEGDKARALYGDYEWRDAERSGLPTTKEEGR